FQGVMRQFGLRPDAQRAALDNVGRALQEVQNELARLPGAAPQSAQAAAQAMQLVSAASASLPPPGGGGFFPRPIPPVGPGADDRLVRQGTALAAAADRVVRLLRARQAQSPAHYALAREAEGLAVQIQEFRTLVDQGAPLLALRRSFDAVRSRIRQLDQGLRQLNAPGLLRQEWFQVAQEARAIGDLLGVPPDFAIDPGQPVPINPPAFPNLPWAVQPVRPVRPAPGGVTPG